MSDSQEIIDWIEIDYDYCSRTFGVGPCTAVLSALAVPNKCHNTAFTCPVKNLFTNVPKVLRFVNARTAYPKGATFFPCLNSVTNTASTVNISGADDDLSPLGRRAVIKAALTDFPYHDRYVDKYQAERISGAAQFSGIGYDPADNGTFFSKMRARWPYYAGRPLRRCTGTLSGGVLTVLSTRHYIMTDMEVAASGEVTIEAKDILDLADNDRAKAPFPSTGNLVGAMTTGSMSFTITPAGTGALEYPASGRVCIGSEVMGFTRVGDVFTVTVRGASGTTIAAHSIGDGVQLTFSRSLARIDAVVKDLLVGAGVNIAFIPFTAWQAEVNRWAPSLRISVDICKPEGVAKLIGELAVLGISIWWDDVAQLVGFRMNRPPDLDAVKVLTERNSLISFESEDRNKDRLTQMSIFTVVLDPTKGLNADNFARQKLILSADAVQPYAYNDSHIKEVFCRWLNHGDDAAVLVLGRRYLQRFSITPIRYKFVVDSKDDMDLVDVAYITTSRINTTTGRPATFSAQMISREEDPVAGRIEYLAQSFPDDQRYAYITGNTRPVFTLSSAAQKARGAYICNNVTKLMSDGSQPYRFI